MAVAPPAAEPPPQAEAPPRLFDFPGAQLEVEVLPLRETLLAGGPAENYYLVILRSQAAGGQVSQVTLNLGLLLDKSHSMLGGPFAQATEGALAVMSQLDRRDHISILVFDEAAEPVVVQATTQALPEAAKKLRAQVIAGGRTDLEAALTAGGRALELGKRPQDAHKLLLLTDGRPTAGALEPAELTPVAEGLRAHHISLSCIGLGLDYDEELLMALADKGGGHYYHSSRPRDVKKLFQREMAAFKNIHLRELELRISPVPGFGLTQVVHYESRMIEGSHRIPLPDLEKAEELEILLKVQGEPHTPGIFKAFDFALAYQPVGEPQGDEAQGFGFLRFSDDPAAFKGVGNHPRVDRALAVKNVQSHLLSTIQGLKTQTLSRQEAHAQLKEYQKTLVLKGRTLEAMEIGQAIQHLGAGQEEEAVKELGQSAFSLKRGPRTDLPGLSGEDGKE
ncbi:MAG TPA: VWA domain-containing protein [bacterium]|nr:VWA domain-containing protein [bacterium]